MPEKLTPEKLAELRRLASVWESEKPRLDSPIDYRDELLLRASLPALIEAAEERDRLMSGVGLAEGPHHHPVACPTWHDNCHCTAATLEHNIKRADAAEERLADLEQRMNRFRENLLGPNGRSYIPDPRYVADRLADILGEEGDDD